MIRARYLVYAITIVLSGLLLEIFFAVIIPAHVPLWIYGLLGMTFSIPLLFGMPAWKHRLAIVGIVLCCYALLYAFPTNSRKEILKIYAKVKTGMAVGDVEDLFSAYSTDARREPDYNGRLQYLHAPDDPTGKYNADVIDITFVDGKMTKKEFLPD